MKISTWIIALLFVGVIFFAFAMMMNEGATKYDVDVNNSVWEGKYDYASDINDSVGDLIGSVNDITSEETGWLEKVGQGFTGIISAVTLLPAMVWKSFSMTGELFTEGFSAINVPAYIITVAIIAMMIWGVFKLVEFFQRWQV